MNKMDDVSSIDSLSENDINISDEEEDKNMLSILSEMKFSAPFEKYIINNINKIIKDNYKKIMPLFEEKEYSLKEIIDEFKNYYPNILAKEKKKLNKSLDAPHKKENNNLDLNKSEIKVGNISEINISVGNKKEDSELSFNSLNSANSFDKFLNGKKVNQQKNELNIISKDENTTIKKEIKEFKNFLDVYNVKGTEFECHTQILLTQILKCFEKEENSFKILCNIEYKLGNIYTAFKDMEFDFIINNLDSILFKELIQYLEKNILIFKFKGNMYEIKNPKNFNTILSELTNVKKFDVLGEIGLNAINDDNKTKQFMNYSKFLNYLDKNKNNNDDKINLFYEKTGFSKENEKVLFFVTDSKFNEVYKYLNGSKLYKAMNESKDGTNFVLCYLSSGLNEKIILNKFLINYEEDKENKEGNDYKALLDNIKLSNESYFKSEKFQISCNKLNELFIGINNIKDKFNKNNQDNIETILYSFRLKILTDSVQVNKDLEIYFKTHNSPIKVVNKKYPNEEEFVVIYIKKKVVDKDELFEILKNMKIKFTSIDLGQKEDTIQKTKKKLKNSHNLNKIYFFIGNCLTINEKNIGNFIDDLIINLNITSAHYIFLYKPKYSGNVVRNQHTLNFNIKVSKNEKQFVEQYESTKKKIYSYYNDLAKIFKEKKYYDLLIKIYIQKTKYYIINSLNSDEKNLLKKINEVFYFISNLEFIPNIPEVINESNFKGLMTFIDETIKTFIDSEINDDKINKTFKEIKTTFLKEQNFINSIQSKIKSFCTNYLKRYILDDIYLNFINILIPILSFQSFNEKIKVLLTQKENAITLGNDI